MIRKNIFSELLKISFPLMLTSSTYIVMQFIDRLYLSWYSEEAIAASVTAGMTSFFFASFFIGIASYCETFVAQYHGAKKDKDIGKILWQGFYFSFFAGIFLIVTIPLAREIFTISDHSELIQEYEKTYFTILQFGIIISMIGDVSIAFFAGTGRTKIIFYVIGISVFVNIFFDYALIFGNFGFPKLGIAGAAIATNIAITFRTVVFLILVWRKKYRDQYDTFKARKFNLKLFKRLLKFGAPSGIQWALDMGAFTLFVLFIGMIGGH